MIDRLARHGDRSAIVDPSGSCTYEVLDHDATALASFLHADHRGDHDRIAIVCTPGHDFVTALLACWHAGAIAVPLHPQHPDAELEYVMRDCGARAVVASP